MPLLSLSRRNAPSLEPHPHQTHAPLAPRTLQPAKMQSASFTAKQASLLGLDASRSSACTRRLALGAPGSIPARTRRTLTLHVAEPQARPSTSPADRLFNPAACSYLSYEDEFYVNNSSVHPVLREQKRLLALKAMLDAQSSMHDKVRSRHNMGTYQHLPCRNFAWKLTRARCCCTTGR